MKKVIFCLLFMTAFLVNGFTSNKYDAIKKHTATEKVFDVKSDLNDFSFTVVNKDNLSYGSLHFNNVKNSNIEVIESGNLIFEIDESNNSKYKLNIKDSFIINNLFNRKNYKYNFANTRFYIYNYKNPNYHSRSNYIKTEHINSKLCSNSKKETNKNI